MTMVRPKTEICGAYILQLSRYIKSLTLHE